MGVERLNMEHLTIGKLASAANVNVETVRYYERRGLLPQPPRPNGRVRRYPAETVRRIQFIKRAQELGFTLNEIAELLALRVDPDRSCAEVRERTESKVVEIEGKIRELMRMKAALEKLALSCSGRGPIRQCPILDAL